MNHAIALHGPAVRGLAKRFAFTANLRGHEDDLEQEGLMALVKCFRRDPNAAWEGYYMGSVVGAMKMYARTERRRPETETLGDIDRASVEPSPFDRVDQHGRLAQVYHLPPREREAVILHAMDHTDEEIADGLGVSPRRVRQLRAQGERRLAS